MWESQNRNQNVVGKTGMVMWEIITFITLLKNCVGRAMRSVCRAIMLDANNKRKKMVVQYTPDGVCVSEYPSLREMERQTGFHRAAIKDNINGKSRQSYGFIWKFKEE